MKNNSENFFLLFLNNTVTNYKICKVWNPWTCFVEFEEKTHSALSTLASTWSSESLFSTKNAEWMWSKENRDAWSWCDLRVSLKLTKITCDDWWMMILKVYSILKRQNNHMTNAMKYRWERSVVNYKTKVGDNI